MRFQNDGYKRKMKGGTCPICCKHFANQTDLQMHAENCGVTDIQDSFVFP